jgi:hypothetical protein
MPNVNNPGLVNVADQADGLTKIDQAITTGPSTSAGPVIPAANEAFGKGLATNYTAANSPSSR